MMKIKFNPYERVAGVFVLTSVIGFIVILFGMAVKQGWFESKVHYRTFFENADGIHPGVMVQISGLKAGSVDSVELNQDNRIEVMFYVFKRFQDKVKIDSRAQLIRPFIIGERVLDITMGTDGQEVLANGAEMASQDAVDIMTLMSGKKLGQHLSQFSEMVSNLKTLMAAFLNKDRTQTFISLFDKLDPLVKNLNVMSVEVSKLAKQATVDEGMKTVLAQLAMTTKSLNLMLPEMTEKAPNLAKDMRSLIENLAVLTHEFKAVIPALTAIAPELPKTSRRAVEALDEAVILMKAFQKSFLLRGNVKEVKSEESERTPADEKTNRAPSEK